VGRPGCGPPGGPKDGPPCGPRVSPRAPVASEMRYGFETALRSENRTASGSYISVPLQKERSRVSKLYRIAVPNQDRVFNCWGGSVAATWLRILEPRGHQRALRLRPQCGVKSRSLFRWLGRPCGQRLAVGSLPAAVQSWMALPAPPAPVTPAALLGPSASASGCCRAVARDNAYFTRSVAAAMSAASSSGSASSSAPAFVAHLLISPRWTPRVRAL
jgi:hypothetical protein